MGYLYARDGGLICDNCLHTGARKRTCPFKVTTSSLHGTRQALPFCKGPALCPRCYREEGGARGVHRGCRAKAAADQAREDATEADLDAGELFVSETWGDWEPGVPPGMTGVLFRARGKSAAVLVSSADYTARRGDLAWKLSDSPGAIPWPECPAAEGPPA